MDYASLKTRFDAVRAGNTTCAHATFRWVAPTDGDMRRFASKQDATASSMGRDTVLAALTGWSGVRACDLVAEFENTEEQLDFSREAAAALLDVQTDWLDLLTVDILAKQSARKAAMEEEKKRHEPALIGKATNVKAAR
jgi:hypothetical protein